MRFWVHGDDQPRTAFINDNSTTGVFVTTAYPVPRGTEIRIEILDGAVSYTVEAVVARRVWMAPDLRRLGPSGMGARFLSPDELVERLRARDSGRVNGSKQRDNHYLIALDDDRELLQIYASDLEMGGLFIPTESPPPLNREILVDFRFPDTNEVSTFAARVVQRVAPEQGGKTLRAGMAVVFDKPDAVLMRLRPFLDAPIVDEASGSPIIT
ncbi:MAG TPA: PilZ domain-containing protein [Thermoanaerobaculia bacterium]|nr:PilZ domain-containing protein [Thermoanaerobaculia bacterium]